MKRKDFIKAAGLSTISTQFFPVPPRLADIEIKTFRRPPYLQPGDTIGLTAPAGNISLGECQVAIDKLKEWGYHVTIGSTIGKKFYNFGGTDMERIQDFQQMLDDAGIRAILCARGGYGVIRIIDALNFKNFLKAPKWIIGFSDITVFHAHINSHFHVASLHSKMCNSFPDNWLLAAQIQYDTINSINDCLTGKQESYSAPANLKNRPGMGEGILVGGNLRTIENLSGTLSDLDTKNKILFVEDTDEYMYSIDRMFWNLKRSGKLDHLKGLIVGGFNVKTDPDGDFGKAIEDIVLEKVREFNYPVCFDFPVGHQKNNFALMCGVRHQLVVSQDSSSLFVLENKQKKITSKKKIKGA